MTFKEFIVENKDSFALNYNQLGCCDIEPITVKLKDTKPVYQAPFKRKNEIERELLKKHIKKLEEAKIIRRSRSSYSAPAFFVYRNKVERMVISFKGLNLKTEKEAEPMPRVDVQCHELEKSRFYSRLDFKACFLQLKVQEDNIHLFAFSTGDEHWEFLRLPFGWIIGPAFLMRVMRKLFGHLEFVSIYMDDITIHSKTLAEHIEHIKIVFKILKEANLKLNPEKCEWLQTRVKILGHIVSFNKIEMDETKVKAINEIPYCKNVKEVQSFLGLAGYYRTFIKEFAEIAHPLYVLTRKNVVFIFTKDCQEAMDKLKSKLTSFPILCQPNFKLKFIVYTDAYQALQWASFLVRLDQMVKKEL